jgi:hypothetical protein
MTALELKRIKVELINVAAARANLELKIDESLDNIRRLEDNIAIQKDKEAELQAKIELATDSK